MGVFFFVTGARWGMMMLHVFYGMEGRKRMCRMKGWLEWQNDNGRKLHETRKHRYIYNRWEYAMWPAARRLYSY